MTLFSAGFQQALYTWDDLIVNFLTAERISGSGPSVGQVNIDQCRLFPKADFSLKTALLIHPGGLFKCFG